MATQRKQEEAIPVIDLIAHCLRVLKKIWLQIFIIVVVTAALFGMKTKLDYKEYYTAYSVFTVTRQWELNIGESANYYDNVTAEQTASIFPHILTSEILRNRVAEDMGTIYVPGKIKAEVTENTNILTISVTDSDPQRAYDTLQSIIKNYPTISEGIIGKTTTNILDDSGVPTGPDNALDIRKGVIEGAVFGVALGILWMIIIALTQKTVVKESDIPKYMNIHCLGSIPKLNKKERTKKKEERYVITDPKVEDSLNESLRMVRNKVEYHTQHHKKYVLLITSALAGEGKSTFAVNLALSLAMNGKKVSLIDADLRHPTERKIFNVEEGAGLGEILMGEAKLQDCLMESKKLGLEKDMKLLFLPGGKPMEDGSELLGRPFLERIIDAMRDWGDYVIIDSAPVGLLTDAVVLAENVDGAVYVVRKDYANVEHIMEGMEFLTANKVDIVGGVLNAV